MVILDEFDWRQVTPSVLKAWLDRHPCQAAGKLEPYKEVSANRWIITTQDDPRTWYPNEKVEDRKAICRRINQIQEFKAEEKEGKEAKDPEQELLDMWEERTKTPELPQAEAEPKNEEDAPRGFPVQYQMEVDSEGNPMDVIDLSQD